MAVGPLRWIIDEVGEFDDRWLIDVVGLEAL